jgi:poly-gamma-glutamate synthesis protein (capsule biosynthesis protein)
MLVAVGDVNVCEGVEALITTRDVGFLFDRVRSLLDCADLCFCNLENVFTTATDGIPAQAHLLKARPESLTAIQAAGFNVVSLANNHIFDYREQGLRDTRAALEALEIKACGAGSDLRDARQPVIMEQRGVRFGFLAYTVKGVQSATEQRAGAAVLDMEQMRLDIQALVPQVDHVILSIHAGLEFVDYPHPDFRESCRALVRIGVRLVIGHGPHVLQGAERYGAGLICYSLGNFVFDNALMDLSTNKAQEGLLLSCQLDKYGIVDYEITPVVINASFQPEPAVEERGIAILARLRKVSEALIAEDYTQRYYHQASELWSTINIAVNLRLIREQGIVAFIRRLPRFKLIYLVLLVRFVLRKLCSYFRARVRP